MDCDIGIHVTLLHSAADDGGPPGDIPLNVLSTEKEARKMACSIMVRWKEGEIAGFTDILPLEWFATEGALSERTHTVEGNWGGGNWRGLARFDLVVHGLIADLNYEKHREFNNDHRMEIGIMRIQFGDTGRANAKKVLWKAADEKSFRNASVDITVGEPSPSDAAEPPKRVKSVAYRVLRDTKTSQEVKLLHGGECQICGHGITLPDGTKYAEAHHIQPLGGKHKGLDIRENIVCVCPNHHVELDYGLREIRLEELRITPTHAIGKKYVDYYNRAIVVR